MKLRTTTMLQDYLDRDISWRVKEMANLKLWLRSPRPTSLSTAVRAAVPLLYAHWEGFVKSSAVGYVNYVSCQRRRYDELADCFIALGMRRHLHDFATTNKAKLRISAIGHLLGSLESRAILNASRAIDTKSNLNSTNFEQIAIAIGIDPTPYEPRYHLIDESLLRRRNGIAHGEFLELEPLGCRDLADQVIALLRSFKTDIENAATRQRYLRQSAR